MHTQLLAYVEESRSSISFLTIIGVALIAAGGYFGYRWWTMRRKRRAMLSAETLTAAELKQLAGAASEAAGPGAFNYRCEIVGAATPARSGSLVAQMSNTKCVWHRHTITHHYWDRQRDRNGRTEWRQRTKQIADMSSEMAFGVKDDTGAIAVDPRGAQPEAPQKVLDKFEKASDKQQKSEFKIGSFQMSLPRLRHDGETIGYQYEEWVLRPNSRVYVLGEARDSTGQLMMGKPSEGPFIISTKSEQEMAEHAEKNLKWTQYAAPAGLVLGAILVVVSLLT